jgi:hypothetical protein
MLVGMKTIHQLFVVGGRLVMKFVEWSTKAANYPVAASISAICLLVSLSKAGQAQQATDRKREFLEMYARACYPGRSGQIMLVPREGEFVPLMSPPHSSCTGVHGRTTPTFLCCFLDLRRGTDAEAAVQQDIVRP